MKGLLSLFNNLPKKVTFTIFLFATKSLYAGLSIKTTPT
jgi:hypothetical protein